MKTILKFESDMSYQLEIHSENDIEAIALQAWSERYFKDIPFVETAKNKASLIIIHTLKESSTYASS